MGRRNPIATETAAAGKLRPGAAMRDALALDLDALQRLSVTESTLVAWVDDVVSGGMPEAWRAAGMTSWVWDDALAVSGMSTHECGCCGGSLTCPDNLAELNQQRVHLDWSDHVHPAPATANTGNAGCLSQRQCASRASTTQ